MLRRMCWMHGSILLIFELKGGSGHRMGVRKEWLIMSSRWLVTFRMMGGEFEEDGMGSDSPCQKTCS